MVSCTVAIALIPTVWVLSEGLGTAGDRRIRALDVFF
jgi:hypothetical protein